MKVLDLSVLVQLLGGGWLLTVLLGAVGCQTTGVMDGADQLAAEEIPILWQESGTYSRLVRPVRILARDRATLAQVPLAEVPVDFDQQMVLIAGMGPTPHSGTGIRITRVWKEGRRIRVQERHIHPGLGEASGVEASSPWTIVVIPRSELNVQGYRPDVPARLLQAPAGLR
jgi:hypothetical protein